MEKPQNIYIALGSNKGDKFKNLQLAIDQIHLKIGAIKSISKAYKSPAFGFEGDDFLNACILVNTHMKPKKVMSTLLAIEKDLGRTRGKKTGYESRVIDLDLLLFEDEVLETKSLTLPHPEMQKRLFVLQPLADIAGKVIHPKLHNSVIELLEDCEDKSEISPINIWLKNPSKAYDFSLYNYIAIEGNIGAR